MKKKQKPHKRFTRAVAEKCADLYAQGCYTVQEICDIVGISETNFYDKRREDKYFRDILKEKEEMYYSRRLEMAEKGQKILLEGHKWKETKKSYKVCKETGDEQLQSIEETEKVILPNPAVVIHALKSLKPEIYKEQLDLTSKNKKIEFPPIVIKSRDYDGDSD